MPLIVDGVKVWGKLLFLALFVFGFVVFAENASASECTIFQDYSLTGGYSEQWKCGGSNNCPFLDAETLKESLDKFGGRKYSNCMCPDNCGNVDRVYNGNYRSHPSDYVADASFLSACAIGVSFYPSAAQRNYDSQDPGTGNPALGKGWYSVKVNQAGNAEMCDSQCKIYDGTKSVFDGEFIGCNVGTEEECNERVGMDGTTHASECVWGSWLRRAIEWPDPGWEDSLENVNLCTDVKKAGVIAEGRWSVQPNPAGWYVTERVNNKRMDSMSDTAQIGFGLNGIFCRIDFKTQCIDDIDSRDINAKIFVDGTGEVLWGGELYAEVPESGYNLAYAREVYDDELSRPLEDNEAVKCEIIIDKYKKEAGPVIYNSHIDVSMQAEANTDEVITCSGVVTSETGATDFDVIVNVNGGSGIGNPSGIEPCHIADDVADGQTSCIVNVLIPKEYTKINDVISCSMRAYDWIGYSNLDSASVKIKNRIPELKSVQIIPDYLAEYSQEEWVTYSAIFEHDMKCVFSASDVDSEDAELKYTVEVEIETTGKNGRPLIYKIGTQKVCPNPLIPPSVTIPPTPPCNEFVIPKDEIYPSDKQKCKVKVTDNFDGSDEKADSNDIPSFDLTIQEIDVMNVISGDILIAEKPLAGRVFPAISSNLIDELDRTLSVNLVADDKNGYKAGKKGSISNLWKFYGIGTLKANALKDMGGGKIGADFLRKIKRAKDSVNIIGFNLPKEGTYYFSGKLITADAKGKIKESDGTNNIVKDAFASKVWKQSTVYDIGIVVIGDPADISTFNGNDVKIIDKNIAFMFAGGPLYKGKTNIKWLGNHYIEYDRGKLLAHDEESFEYADELQRGLMRGTLEDFRSANNLDFAVGYIIDKEIMLLGSGSYAQGLSIGSTKSVLVLRNAGADTLLHEMSHVYTENGEHTNVAISEPGWCIDQYKIGQVSVCEVFNSAEKYGHSATRINIWTEMKAGETEHQSTLDVPEHLQLSGSDFTKLKMGNRYVNIHSFFNNPSNWHNAEYYIKMRQALGGFYAKP